MASKKVNITIYSYGEYTKWDRTNRALPKIVEITETIEAGIGTEFGYVLKIERAKGKKLQFKIIHPPFKDEKGNITPDFDGEHFISSNDYSFFLGDCVWEPLENKLGPWQLITWLDGKIVADKTLTLIRKG